MQVLIKEMKQEGRLALSLDSLLPGGDMEQRCSTFVTIDSSALAGLVAMLSGHIKFQRTMCSGHGSRVKWTDGAPWGWKRRLLFVLVRLGTGIRTRHCLQLLGLLQSQEDTFNRSFTFTLRALANAIRTTWGRPWTVEMVEE